MGKIASDKKSFRWSGTAKSLKSILAVQRYLLVADRLKAKYYGTKAMTLQAYLTKVYN